MSSPITPVGDAAPRSTTPDEPTALDSGWLGVTERTAFEAALARLEALPPGALAPSLAPLTRAPAATMAALDHGQFHAALERLQVPVSPQGAQRWSFAFDDTRHALSCVQLDGAKGEPWQLTLRVQPGDRAQLLVHLDGLRTRLMQRGAQIGALRCEADEREEHR